MEHAFDCNDPSCDRYPCRVINKAADLDSNGSCWCPTCCSEPDGSEDEQLRARINWLTERHSKLLEGFRSEIMTFSQDDAEKSLRMMRAQSEIIFELTILATPL